ncbi:hypothetical protein FA95DRAFT_495266 [Auriscalpium vulgare]|uniref:Uncharacterized protein n=1 Tax=Auriscalpium vulgare TaxID=40419 RepID=A0ACB8S353_9AGAM|nr:hypothetical protein FA95DRAFT_495266 [Auriscalpium vulgare]
MIEIRLEALLKLLIELLNLPQAAFLGHDEGDLLLECSDAELAKVDVSGGSHGAFIEPPLALAPPGWPRGAGRCRGQGWECGRCTTALRLVSATWRPGGAGRCGVKMGGSKRLASGRQLLGSKITHGCVIYCSVSQFPEAKTLSVNRRSHPHGIGVPTVRTRGIQSPPGSPP